MLFYYGRLSHTKCIHKFVKNGHINDEGIQKEYLRQTVLQIQCRATTEQGITRVENKQQSTNGRVNGLQYVEEEQQIQVTKQKSLPSFLLFLPGTDGTSRGLQPHVQDLVFQGWDVKALYLSPFKTPSWQDLTDECVSVLKERRSKYDYICLICESFGACLGLRVALQRPDLVDKLVLINSATAFKNSLFGFPGLFAQTNILANLSEDVYNLAGAILTPFVLRPSRVGDDRQLWLKSMMHMEPQLDDELYVNLDRSERYDGNVDRQPYPPAQAGNHRLNLLRKGDLSDKELRNVKSDTLVICSTNDDLFNSVEEGSRLLKLIPNCQRLCLPNRYHTMLLDEDVSLANILRSKNVVPPPYHSPNKSIVPTLTSNNAYLASRTSNSSSIPNSSTYATPTLLQNSTSTANNCNPPSTISNATSTTNDSSPTSTPYKMTPTHTPNPTFFRPDVQANWERTTLKLMPLRRLLSPIVVGQENIPDDSVLGKRPIIFAGNHSMYGFVDTFLLGLELGLRGVQVVGVAHPGHWLGPIGPVFKSFGAIKASPMTMYKELQTNRPLLLFPGGAREVNKRRGQQYQLLWDKKPNLVRMAMKAKALVIPFSVVGVDDAYDIYMDPDQILNDDLLGRFARYMLSQVDPNGELDRAESVAPISYFPGTRIPSLLPIPSMQRLYFKFSAPIDFGSEQYNPKDREQCLVMYKTLQKQVRQGIEELQLVRQNDDANDLGTRMVNAVKDRLPFFDMLQ